MVFDPQGMLGTNSQRVSAELKKSAKDGASVYVAIIPDTGSLSAKQWALDSLEKSHAPKESYLLEIIPSSGQLWYLATPGPHARLSEDEVASVAIDTVVPALNEGNMAKAVTSFNQTIQSRSRDASGAPLWLLIVLGVLLGAAILALIAWIRRRKERARAPQSVPPDGMDRMNTSPQSPRITPYPSARPDAEYVAQEKAIRPMPDSSRPNKKRRFFARKADDEGYASSFEGSETYGAPADDIWSRPAPGVPEAPASRHGHAPAPAPQTNDGLTSAMRQAGVTDERLLNRVAAAQAQQQAQMPPRGQQEWGSRPTPMQQDPRRQQQWEAHQQAPMNAPQHQQGWQTQPYPPQQPHQQAPQQPDWQGQQPTQPRYSNDPLPRQPREAGPDGTRYIELAPARSDHMHRPDAAEPPAAQRPAAGYEWQQRVHEGQRREGRYPEAASGHQQPQRDPRAEHYPRQRGAADPYASQMMEQPHRQSAGTGRPHQQAPHEDGYRPQRPRPVREERHAQDFRGERHPVQRPAPLHDERQTQAPQDDRYASQRPVPTRDERHGYTGQQRQIQQPSRYSAQMDRPDSVRERVTHTEASTASRPVRRQYQTPATSATPRTRQVEPAPQAPQRPSRVPAIPPLRSAARPEPSVDELAQTYLDQMVEAAAHTGMTPHQADRMRELLADAARHMAEEEAGMAAAAAAPAPEPFDVEAATREARERAQAEMEARRAERARAEQERREAEEAERLERARRARVEADAARRAEAQARERAQADARKAAEEQRRRNEAEAERRRAEAQARAEHRARQAQAASNQLPAAPEAPATSQPPARPQRFAQALREADTLCRATEGSLEVVKVQFGNSHTQSYAQALAQARRAVTEGLDLFADAQLNQHPLTDNGYLEMLSDAVTALREQAARFATWRHAESSVDDIAADLEEFFLEAESGLSQTDQVLALIEPYQPSHVALLANDVNQAYDHLNQARSLLGQARSASDQREASSLTQRAERAVLDAVLVGHRVEDWKEYARNQRTRDAAADADTALKYSTEAVVCYMAALDDFMSLHRSRVSLAARTMLMLANKTLTRVDAIGSSDPERALRLIDQAEQQAEQADRLATAALENNNRR